MSLTPHVKVELDIEPIKENIYITCTEQQFQTKCDCTVCVCIAKGIDPFDTDCFKKHEIKTEQTVLNRIKTETAEKDAPTNNNDRAPTCLSASDISCDEKICISEVKVEFSETHLPLQMSTQKELVTVGVGDKTLLEPQISEIITKQLKVVLSKTHLPLQISTQKETTVRDKTLLEPHTSEIITKQLRVVLSKTHLPLQISTQKEITVGDKTLLEPHTSEKITKQLKVVLSDVLLEFQPRKEVDVKGLKIALNDFLREPWSGKKVILRDLTVLLTELGDHNVKDLKSKKPRKRKRFFCELCEYRTIFSHHFDAHLERHKKPVLFYCYNCPYKTKHKSRLGRHLIVHSKSKQFQCQLCPKMFHRETQLVSHRLCKHADTIPALEKKLLKEKMRRCQLCPYKTLHLTSFRNHMASCHHNSDTPKLRCDKCEYSCFTKNLLIKHLRIHSDVRKFACMYCDSKFTKKDYLMFHVFHVHRNERHNLDKVVTRTIHKCQFCDYQNLSPRSLASHIRNKHKKLLNSTPNCHCQQKHCQECSLSRFLTRFSKIPKTFRCNYCELQFEEKRQINDHLFKQHRNDMQKAGEAFPRKIYSCKWCEYQNLNTTHLSQHVVAKHKNMLTPEFKCGLCGREFYRKSHLTKHVEAHADVKEFSCKPCGVEFRQKRYMDTHIFIHHKNDEKLMKSISYKMYECPQCSFATSYPDRLDTHRKSSKAHKIPKTFKCNYCEMQFEIKRHLNMHLFKQHRNDMQKAGEVFPKKIYSCKWCEYQNLNRTQLSQHVVAKHKNMLTPEFKCGMCEREFYLKRHFTKHVEAHADGKRFSCKPCGVAFIQKRYMDTHIFIHHKDDKMLMKSITYEIYECPHCLFATSYADRLDSHIRSKKHGK